MTLGLRSGYGIGAFLLLSLAFVLALLMAWDSVRAMVANWSREEYSYGYFVPFLVIFFIWQKKNALAETPFEPSWLGLLVAFGGLFLVVFGELATLYVIAQYGFLVVLHGVALAALGWRAYRIVAVPLALLFFVVPLPEFLYNNLSQSLQLISSEIGVWFVRLFGISVFLEGNVIHLAEMQLQVVEACSGLRYLFPLMAVGFIVAYIFKAPLWKKAVVFLSTIPITVLMNSLRIGLIGITVEYWGREMADGILHDFEGWVVFMSSLGVLLLEMWLLNFVGQPRRAFADAFHIEWPGPLPEGTRFRAPGVSAPLVAALALLLGGAILSSLLPDREEVVPVRAAFAQFPGELGGWQGRVDRLESIFVDALKFDDYLLADYTGPGGARVNLYAAYYGSQRKGASVHSPRTCIPGGGWEIGGLSQRTIEGASINGRPLTVNRAVIRKGESAQLVYYWFQQRGRVMTNEYLVKWYLFQDALNRQRTDGALVRLTTDVPPGSDAVEADRRLAELARLVAPEMERFIPN